MARNPQKNLFGLSSLDLAHILHGASADLAELRGRSLFLTGGTGLFGKWLLAAFSYANAELGLDLRVTVLSRDPASFLHRHPEVADESAFRFVPGHVAEFSLDGHRPDYIIHAAADTTAISGEEGEHERRRAIISGTSHVLELAKKSGARRLLNLSSGAVYGALVGQLAGASEDNYAAAIPLMPYGEAKREAERLCEESGIDFVTARGFAFVGPHLSLDTHFAAGNFLRDALSGGPIRVRGDGTALRSYLYLADLVVWLLRLLVRGQHARAYNVGSDEAVTTAQLARMIADTVRPQAEVIIQSLQPQGVQNIYLPNLHRARTELGLGVALPLPHAIARTLAFLQPSVA